MTDTPRPPGRERLSPSGRRAHAVSTVLPLIERARTFSGWSFDNINTTDVTPPPPWDYIATARDLAATAHNIIDLGTGGGERYQRIIEACRDGANLYASEEWHVNAPVARDRLTPLGVEVVHASSERTPWRDATFDLILSRHEAIIPSEIVRILRPRGVFLTQQVAHSEWRELAAFFPNRAAFPDHLTEYRRDFEAAGLQVETREHTWAVAYPGIGEIAFMLLISPWEIPGFDPVRDIEQLVALEDAHGTNGGVVLTHARYLMTARKAE